MMATTLDLLSGPVWRHLLAALAHTLWQGALVALLLRVVLRRVSTRRTGARYAATIAALGAVVLGCLITWSVLDIQTAHGLRLPSSYSQGLQGSMAEAPATRLSGIPARVPADTSRSPDEPGLSTSSDSSRHSPWVAVGVAVWLAGAALMLARTAWLVTGAQRLAGGPLLIDQRVDALLTSLHAKLGIRRAIAVVDAGMLGPAVIGIVRPVLLLPGALLAGMPAECLEAMLAHELAHIRRHDYLVNLLQMFVEALLYFNPAVWWISRQIRREREACCDRIAATATGQPIDYAQALATWIERTPAVRDRAGALLPAFASDHALDRIRRLLVAEYRPELRASWRMLVGSFVTSAVVLGVVWRGTQSGVALAAEILSPAQRISRLSQQRDELRPMIPIDGSGAKLTGTISTSDGKPVPKGIDGTVYNRNERLSSTRSVTITAPEFSVISEPGTTWMSVFADGYAPALVGPLQVRPDETIDGLKIVLEPGYASQIKVLNEQGGPVRAAKASGLLSEIGSGNTPNWEGNDRGEIELDHLANLAYDITIVARGYQTLARKKMRFRPGETTTLTLVKGVQSSGDVVDPAGKPIAGATLRCALQVGPGSIGSMSGDSGQILATTDASGQFILDSLDNGAQYALLVETDGHGRRLFTNVAAGQTDLHFVVGPDLTVRGRIVGDFGKLARDRQKQPIVRSTQNVSVQPSPDMSYGLLFSGETIVDVTSDEGHFEVRNLLPGDATLAAGPRTVALHVSEPAIEVMIDLDEQPAKPEMRSVVLNFVGPDPGLFPTGQVRVFVVDQAKIGPTLDKVLAIDHGRVELEAYATGYVSYSAVNVVGYWFKDDVLHVTPGDGALEHRVPILPAGAVRGRVTNVDGSRAAGEVRLGTRGSLRPTAKSWQSFAIDNVLVDAVGEFFVAPLPFGTEKDYVLRASRGHENAISAPIHIDAQHVSPWVEIQFSATKRASGQVVGPDGTPRADVPVTLAFRHPDASTSYSPAPKTDAQGRFEFDGLSTGVGEYWASIRREGQPPIEERLNLGGEPVRFVLPE